MEDTILAERRGDIAIVTINRPDKRNALRHGDWVALADTLDALGDEDSVRCVVLRGAGNEANCAGSHRRRNRGGMSRDHRANADVLHHRGRCIGRWAVGGSH